MERSKMITNKIKHTALLSRLSREDDLQGDSESIQTQKAMLEQYASKNGFTNIIHYYISFCHLFVKFLIRSSKNFIVLLRT